MVSEGQPIGQENNMQVPRVTILKSRDPAKVVTLCYYSNCSYTVVMCSNTHKKQIMSLPYKNTPAVNS